MISAFIFGSQAGCLLKLLFESEHQLYVSDYIDREFKAKLEDKWPEKADRVYGLYRRMDFIFCKSAEEMQGQLRDEALKKELEDMQPGMVEWK